MLVSVWEKRYRKALLAKKMTYQEWIGACRKGSSCGTPGENGNQERRFYKAERGELLVFSFGEGRVDWDAVDEAGETFGKSPELVLAYGAEDVEDPHTGERRSPWWKPAWSPDTFCSYFYWGSVVLVRKAWLQEIDFPAKSGLEKPSILLEDFYGFVQEMVRIAGGFQKGCGRIASVPQILYHSSTEAVQLLYQQYGMEKNRLEGAEADLVSVIIPSMNHPELLERCLSSLVDTKEEIPIEIIIVDNGSTRENQMKVRQLLDLMVPGGIYCYQPMPFHFSKMCNIGAKRASGKYLLFLNDDVELCRGGWLGKMVRHAERPYAGAVGIKLLYPGGDLIQHDGITNLPMGPVHKLQFLPDAESYDHGRNRFDWNVLAVTGACLMCRKELFWEAGGFSEEFAVAFNDVALCFGLWELGYSNVVVNEEYAFHHESLSRGADESIEKLNRLQAERKRLYLKYPGLLGRDPYYPQELNRDCLDTRIRPAYVTARNVPQRVSLVRGKLDAAGLRRDDCLIVRIEACSRSGIQGYSVVLGDNNACYEKTLVLCQPGEEDKPGVVIYCQKLEGQYRPDLEENLPDQKNVALCGFCLTTEEPAETKQEKSEEGFGFLPLGEFRIGILALHRVSGLRLINWSNRMLHNSDDFRAKQSDCGKSNEGKVGCADV